MYIIIYNYIYIIIFMHTETILYKSFHGCQSHNQIAYKVRVVGDNSDSFFIWLSREDPKLRGGPLN